MIDESLIRVINRGRCFVLIGAGASAEMGYPDWQQLAAGVVAELQRLGLSIDEETYAGFLKAKKYPELLQQAQVDLRDRGKLISIVKDLLVAKPGASDTIYETLTKWPIACYLTTNFDDEIHEHLQEAGYHFATLRNRRKDFQTIRDGASGIIVKLHSDLQHPEEAVLTSSDYHRLHHSSKGEYYRTKLRQIFELFDVLIVGHSLSDPDVDYVLGIAQETASPDHPVFLLGPDISAGQQREYRDHLNIKAISYDNRDGTHYHLRRMLTIADKFVVHRNEFVSSTEPVIPEHEVQAASSMLIYRRLQSLRQSEEGISDALITPAILSALSATSRGGVTVEGLCTAEPLKSLIGPGQLEQIRDTVLSLKASEYIVEIDGQYSLSDKGNERVAEVAGIREMEEEQAYGQFAVGLRTLFGALSSDDESLAVASLKVALVSVFRTRGLSMASNVFAVRSWGGEDLPEMFGSLANAAAVFDGGDLRSAFVECARAFIMEPTPEQRRYLESLSQGYFLFHLAGLDPTCQKTRAELFERTIWIIDSSVLLSIAAVGSNNHAFTCDLFRRLADAGASIFTTEMLMKETWEHLSWALQFTDDHAPDSREFLAAAAVMPGYRQNLFIDGYVRMSADGTVGTFDNYLQEVCPGVCNMDSLENELAARGIDILRGYVIHEGLEEAKDTIRDYRQTGGTLRGDLQVPAEAEVLQLIKGLRSGGITIKLLEGKFDRAYFVSLSHVLDRISPRDGIVTWTPEAVYRYVSSLPGSITNPDLLQQSMLQGYFYTGVSIIDKPRYLRYFGPKISASKLNYNAEKEKYLEECSREHAVTKDDLDQAFGKTPDLQKPFFVEQMEWRIAESERKRAKLLEDRLRQSEERVKKLEAERESGWRKRDEDKTRQEAARKRNAQDMKHIRKRRRQAKQRKQKK